jgi:hypothetical protein
MIYRPEVPGKVRTGGQWRGLAVAPLTAVIISSGAGDIGAA